MGNSWSQGIYEVVNKGKYIGSKPPIFRSSWEAKFCYYLDRSENIIKWGLELFWIPYYFDLDHKQHKYYPDMYFEVKQNNEIKKMLIEVKPLKQCGMPKPPKIKNQKAIDRYKRELFTYAKNVCKWKAANRFCKEKGITFKIISEKDLFPV